VSRRVAPPTAPRWGRAIAGSAAVFAVLAGAAFLWQEDQSTSASTAGAGRFLVSATDYAFENDRMTWRPGQRVTLTLDNDSRANPGKQHEFMMGRGPFAERTAFGPRPEGGFETDFFRGVEVQISRARDLSMLMPGDARVRRMGGMQMGEDQMGGMQMGEGEMGGMRMGGAAAEHGGNGFMLMLEPGGSVTISFVVPNKPGRWEFACFQQTGQHYLNGMRGWVTIESA
jgi:hypothetical protein